MPEHVIFVAHPSGHLTDYIANGDGLIAHGFLSRLAARGYKLHVAADQVTLRQPLPNNIVLYPLELKAKQPAVRLAECSLRMRLLFSKLRRTHRFGLILQMNPVYPGISLSLLGVDVPLVLGTYVSRWATDPTHAKDAYSSASGWAAKLRDLVVGLQQRQAAALLVTTPAARDRIPFYEPNAPKIFELSHGVDAKVFAPVNRLGPSQGDRRKRVLFLASVSERKGIFDLLAALPTVIDRVPDVELTIAGAGADLTRARERVGSAGLSACVKFLGSVPREQTPAIYREHDLYCLPSYGEPYATTLLEAMASGLPIVSTCTGGTPYLVPDKGGSLVQPGDVGALAAALVRILQDGALCQSMGEINRQTVLQRYAWEKVIDRLEEIYYVVTKGQVGRQNHPINHGTERHRGVIRCGIEVS